MFDTKILLATDFSKSAYKLLGCLDEFKALGLNSVFLLHVIESRRRGVSAEVVDEFRQKMIDLEKEVEARGLKVESDIVIGKPSEEITKIAEEKKCAVILIASHGQGIIKQIILGSTTYKVLRNSRVPVFIEKYEKGKEDEIEPICKIEFSRVVVPIDCTTCSSRIIKIILSLDHIFHNIILVHSVEKSFDEEEFMIKKSKAAEDLASYKQELEDHENIKNVTIKIGSGSASNLILEAAREENASLIMMPTLGLDHLEELKIGSTADRIVRKAELPLFMIPCDPILNQDLTSLFSEKEEE